MLEEYLCLGGNEVANNARTYGYATTANCPLSWFRCEPCETLHDAINDWVPSEYRWIELRRNFITNPSFETDASGWNTYGANVTIARSTAQAHGGTASLQVTQTTAGTKGVQSVAYPVTVGTSYALSAWVLSTAGTAQTAVILSWYNGGSFISSTSGTLTSLTIGTWTRLSVVGVAPATATQVYAIVSTPSAQIADIRFVDEFLLEASTVVETYFDGDSAGTVNVPVGAGDIDYAWASGPPGPSIQQQYTVVSEGYSATQPYTYANIEDAPWYDQQKSDLTSRFYGAWIVSVTGVDDSTRTATVTEAILDGGVVGLVRHAAREMVVTALLPAEGQDALEYGLSWLDAALAADGCSSHGSACGAVDMTFLGACPDPETPDGIVLAADAQTRHLHNVTVTSGPLIIQRLHSNDGKHFAYIVEWTMVAGTPFVFGQTTEIEVQPSIPLVIQDVPYNLVPYPSAELPGSTVVVATNYSTNPSVEVNATNWSAWGAVDSGTSPAAFITGARSTDLHAGTGVASFRTRLLGNNGSTVVTNAVSFIGATNVMNLTPATGQRYSFTIWGALFIIAGASGSQLQELAAMVEWKSGTNGSGTTLRADTIGSTTTEYNGKVFSAKSIIPPAGTLSINFYVRGKVRWSSSATAANNSDIQMFADTVAVTTP
jgi:hypothetical protein